MRKALLATTAVVLAAVASLMAVEVLSIIVLSLKDHTYIGARERFSQFANTYIGDVTSGTCRYVDALFPHPYLGFVHHANLPCGIQTINNIGLFGPDFPSERIRDRFVVLVTGGSVAAQFAQMQPTGPRYLETILNKSYRSPTGHPFLILNGGSGAWKQPQQAILFLLYADVVDAVVTLDGFNEHYQLTSSFRFEYPAANFVQVNPIATSSYAQVVTRYMLGRALAVVSQNQILSRSHAAFLIIGALNRLVQSKVVGGGDRRTTVESVFALPSDWDKKKREAWQIGQYKKYIRAMDVVAKDRGVLVAHFIQPAPAIGKTLTPEERAVVGDLRYKEVYQRMADALMQLRSEGENIHSLLDVFSHINESLYVDPIHLRKDQQGESLGYRLMAERIAKVLAETWKLKSRG